MWSFLQSIGTGFLAVLVPVGKGLKSVGRALRWALHFILLGAILVGLFFLNAALHIDTLIPQPVWARTIWLPIFFLLLYLLGWIGWWLWKLLSSDGEASHFPDVDEAWDEAVRALVQAGVNLTDVPLFVVLGRPEAAEEHLFHAAQLNLLVKQTPSGPKKPLHVYASKDARGETSVFVTCPGASLLGRQAILLALEEFPDLEQPAGGGDNFDPSKSIGATLRPGEKEKEIKMVLRRGTGQASARERRAMRREAGLRMPDILPAELDLLTARLAHLCRLIVRDRYPFCPLNGVLVLIPLGGSDTEADAQRTAELCQRDLATLRRFLKTFCPVYGLVCDFETVPGFPEFLQLQEQKDRGRRFGQRFPFVPDLTEVDSADKIRQSVDFLCTSVLREWVYRLYRLEAPGKEDKGPATTRNARLFLLLDELRGRSKWMGRVLSQGVARDTNGLYGGCYIAGTGANRDREQGFVAGVFDRLVKSQNLVCWTDRALAEDVKNHRIAYVGYILIGLLFAGLLALGGVKWYMKSAKPARPLVGSMIGSMPVKLTFEREKNLSL